MIYQKQTTMKVTLTKGFQRATFTWNDELTECDYVLFGVEDSELDEMMAAKAHEGADYKDFTVSIEL